ncbi:hypothetical protein Acr_28g0013110 [Actinidia rufa]|uniref:Uncharacterized protein n=1 Tax=Actinidia rufa TaxID=165716 RepID=A0A7J0HBZ4_9ERIC|nr:hypothetical protein Acr_28g0013110 [Actinidia rufa]
MAPTPKRSFLPLLLLFLLSLSALFLFSLYHSSARPLHSSPSFLTQRPCNPTSQTTNDNKIFTLVIKVLAFDRLSSLSRCLRSLSGADYGGDRVNLHVYIDHLKNLGNGSVNLDEKLNESRRILDFVDGFSWKFGKKMVHYRTGNVGLQAQWLEAWWPSSDDEFAFVVEDDLEVSPLYYKFLRGLIENYYYNASNFSPWIYGASLQRPSFSHERALSVSHRDAGVNYGKTAGPDSYLLDKNSLDFDLLEMQPLSKLKWYDFCFRRVLPDRVVRSINELGSVLHSLQKLETVILVSVHKVPQTVTRNLLCHFERQNIQNYILVGSESNFLLDFARQGHPVIDTDQFLDNMQARKFKKSSIELIKDILVKAYVVKKTLELGYNIGVMDGNTLPVSGDLFLESIDPSYDFYFGNTFKVLLVKSSSSAKKIWVEDFIYKVAVMVESSKSNGGGNFVYIVAKLLEQMGVKNKGIDEMSFDLSIDASNRNQTSLADGKKMVFWSYEMGTDLIRKRLEELGMWVVDGDSSCTAVVCHQS